MIWSTCLLAPLKHLYIVENCIYYFLARFPPSLDLNVSPYHKNVLQTWMLYPSSVEHLGILKGFAIRNTVPTDNFLHKSLQLKLFL